MTCLWAVRLPQRRPLPPPGRFRWGPMASTHAVIQPGAFTSFFLFLSLGFLLLMQAHRWAEQLNGLMLMLHSKSSLSAVPGSATVSQTLSRPASLSRG